MSRLRRRLVDWRFWTALAGCLLVVWLVVSSAQAFKAKDDQINALIKAGARDRQEAAQGRLQASRERDRLLAQQGRLVRLYRDLRTSQETLLAYLRRQGIPLPENLDEPVSPSANKKPAAPATPATPKTVHTKQNHPPPHEPGPPGGTSPPPGGPAPPPPGPGDFLRDLLPEGLLP